MAGSECNRKHGASRHLRAKTVRPPIYAPSVARKNLSVAVAITFAVSLVLWLYSQTIPSSLKWTWLRTPPEEWEDRRQQVKDAFVTSWDAYSKYAWGYDQFHPISKKGSMMSPKGLGWIIVDSLDTMMIMNLTSQLTHARLWLHRKLDYDQDQDVNTFETTIRMLGGLLSAHYLSTLLPGVSSRRDNIYLSKAVDLADRLLSAYDSPSGIPYASIHLASRRGIRSHADGGASSTAEATTLQLEMKHLSNITGNDIYWRKAAKVMEVLDGIGIPDGLVPIFVEPHSGSFTTREIRLGSRGDSYYEYLIKQYLQTSETIYLDMWEEALAGIQKHLIIPTKHAKLNIVAELPSGIGGALSPKMDHLVCFLPGSIALGVTDGLTEAEARRLPSWSAEKAQQMKLARELTKTCWGMYKVTETGIAPEIVWFRTDEASLQSRSNKPPSLARSSNSEAIWKEDYDIKPLDAHNLQRPETVESLFVMWRITKDPIYREWGWEIFKAFQKHSIVGLGEGYSSLNNVNAIPPPRRDNMESFWLAETLKYLYLLFSPDDVLPLTEVVFNTEAHVLPRISLGKFKTGWERKREKRN
ncbi:mannosyl-oligosaccharide 1,2-alpha-mannosidase [Mytilinidion resinicola]|uniref:alpha-1,2-Mannosidase n=1 Tax=Mytilinidion resinicola TaxID=574789 RepID=A0A6A6YFU4_9PEZI|nr:mannosyl-oligosaccharide 1,2-alpha-mannosidase [Mytilinidion resinicola]KAF2807610.1 mannosyl-oligosaccharide 1,2-alpha-mannosidase [Mytilinidion resinicola]